MRTLISFALAAVLGVAAVTLSAPAHAGVVIGIGVPVAPPMVAYPPLVVPPFAVGVYPRPYYYGYYPRYYGPGYVRFGYGWGYGYPRGYYYHGRMWHR